MDDEIHSHHDDHQEDDAPLEGEKRVKRHKASKSSMSAREETVIDEDEVISKDETPELIIELHDVDKCVPTIFDYERMKATLNDALSNQFKNSEEVYKQNQRKVRDNPEDYFSKHRITEVVRITTNQPHGLDFIEQIIVMREDDKPCSFSEADFKYLNKNDIEDLYYLCRNKKVNYRETNLMNSLITFIKSRVIWERVHDFQLGIESYQIKVNLIAPTLTVPRIEAHEPFSIVDKPSTGLIYLNSKDKKQVMYLTEIVKFCDATLEKVLKEVNMTRIWVMEKSKLLWNSKKRVFSDLIRGNSVEEASSWVFTIRFGIYFQVNEVVECSDGMRMIAESEWVPGKMPGFTLAVRRLVPSCCVIFDLEPLSLSSDFVLNSKIFKSFSFLLTISLDNLCLDNLDIFKEDLEYHSYEFFVCILELLDS
ncbi:hypothetical protein Tco_1541194 [Tanacetum coccineum]